MTSYSTSKYCCFRENHNGIKQSLHRQTFSQSTRPRCGETVQRLWQDPRDCVEERLWICGRQTDLFAIIGSLSLVDPTSRFVSDPFQEFDDYRDADDAVYELNGKDLAGERIIVEHAKGPMSSRDRDRDRDRGGYRDRYDYRGGGGGFRGRGGGRGGGGGGAGAPVWLEK